MTFVRRFVKSIRGGELFVFLICAVFVACIKIPVMPQAPTETLATANLAYLPPQETLPSANSAYLPQMVTYTVRFPTISETKVLPITPKTITPVPITPNPTLTLAPGPSPTPFPLVEPAKDPSGMLFFITREGEEDLADIQSLAIDSHGLAEGPASKITADISQSDSVIFPSPNGEFLAFLQPWGEFCLYNTRQGAFVDAALTSLGGGGLFFNWYPDNRRILWGAGSLILSDPISGAHTVLADPGYGEVTAVAASPDGQFVVYAYNTDVIYPKGLWIVNTNGQNANLLVKGIYPRHIIWSPNGKKIAYYENGWQVMNSDGSNLREVAPGIILPQCHPIPAVWSPDGQNLAVVTSQFGQAFCHGWTDDILSDTNIQIIDVNTGKARSLVQDNRAGNIDPTWSPDGSQLAFVSNRSGSPEIWAINVNGTNLREITKNNPLVRYPSWSKSKQKIIGD